MRFVLQSLAAALASLAVPIGEALWIRFGAPGPPLMNADGSIDDAPERAAMLLLFLSPVGLAALAVFFAGSTAVLRSLGVLSLGRLYLLSVAAALVVAGLFAYREYTSFGVRDAAIAFGSLGLTTFISLALGSTAWWVLRARAPGRGGAW
jgi:hypothetical protein